MGRIDTHLHLIPPFYREALRRAGIDAAGGRELPLWSPETSLQTMDALAVSTAILSVSTPGTTFLPGASDAARLARELNEYGAGLVADDPDRFGYFATLPTPHIEAAVEEAVTALDGDKADGVVLLANSAGTYLGAPGAEALWEALDQRHAVVFVHPAELPGPTVPGISPFATDFLLDTTRAAYLLVRNQVVTRYPHIRFILSHGGGFVPYAAHRMAVALSGETGMSILDALDGFRSFYFDTALTSNSAALPSLLAFAAPGHITFGSDWPFAPQVASAYFAAGLENSGLTAEVRSAIDHDNAAALFPRLGGTAPRLERKPMLHEIRGTARRFAMRTITRAMQP